MYVLTFWLFFQGSFDDPLHFPHDFDEIVQPLRAEYLKGKVTTANLATAQVALSTLGVMERFDEV